MPFVPQESRDAMAKGGLPETVGDLCYLEYKKLMAAWRKERRWTTAHNLFKETFGVTDAQAAKTLAFLVFMNYEVMNYEREKQLENGCIDG